MLNIKVGDMVMVPGRFWRVSGVYIGGFGCENVVELQIVDRKPAQVDADDVRKILVPKALITQRMVYRPTDIPEVESSPLNKKLAENLERSIPRSVDNVQ